MTGTTISDMPYEILLYIFATASLTPFSGPPRWQTSTGKVPVNLAPRPIVEQSTFYLPFSTKPFSVRSEDWAQTVQDSLDTKRMIVLVCKEWMKLGTELLYEAIRIDHGSEALLNALSQVSPIQQPGPNGEDRFELAKWVKRAEISTAMVDIDPFNPSLVWRILRSCPNLNTIVIPNLKGLSLGRARWADENERLVLNDSSKPPTFPNLTTIECYIPQTSMATSRTAVNHNFSGLLEQLLDHAPNLQHITLAGGRWIPVLPFSRLPEPKLFVFSSLTSLRVEADIEGLFHAQPDLILRTPNLSRLIVGGALGAVGPILESCGKQITVLELLDIDPDRITRRWHQPAVPPKEWTMGNILEACSNLQELNIHFSFGDKILLGINHNGPSIILPQLRCININRQTTPDPESPDFEICITRLGEFLANNLEARNLEEITLSGQDEVDRWSPLVQRIHACGRKFERVHVQIH